MGNDVAVPAEIGDRISAWYATFVSVRPRHAYFDEAGAVHKLSQARYERVMNLEVREAIPELAGCRVRFLTLYVRFEDDMAIEIVNASASYVAFDEKGRRLGSSRPVFAGSRPAIRSKPLSRPTDFETEPSPARYLPTSATAQIRGGELVVELGRS